MNIVIINILSNKLNLLITNNLSFESKNAIIAKIIPNKDIKSDIFIFQIQLIRINIYLLFLIITHFFVYKFTHSKFTMQ